MKKKMNWVKLIRSIAFLVVSIVFFSIKFYDVSLIFETGQLFEGEEIVREASTWQLFHDYFDAIFVQNSLNSLLGILFIILGGTELIGVRKNGN